MIVEFLTNHTDEQESEKFKNFRLEIVCWFTKDTEYDPDTYDKERKNIEERTLLKKK